jgi:hypothetical protein
MMPALTKSGAGALGNLSENLIAQSIDPQLNHLERYCHLVPRHAAGRERTDPRLADAL